MSVLTQIIGKNAENLVSNYLQQQGLKLIEANYTCKCGEIDLIMRDGETLVFVEVRYRKNDYYGDGVASVTKYKQHKIIRAATYYLQQNNLYDKVLCRFDVVAAASENINNLQWIKNAFWVRW
jgi:putative endonuclease